MKPSEPHALWELTDSEFQAALKSKKRTIIPVGSIEQHGAHLPGSTDSIIVQQIAMMVGHQTNAFVLPVVAYGVSFEHSPMLNISLTSSTLSSVVTDICVSLSENGIREIIILNGHHGNLGALQYISQNATGKLQRGTQIHTLHYWHFFRAEFDHAGEVETSLMLAIAPNLVKMDQARPSAKNLNKSKAAYASITNHTGSFPMVTGNGVWGDPRKASLETGSRLIREAVNGITATIREIGSE